MTAINPLPPPDSPARRPPLSQETAKRLGMIEDDPLPLWTEAIVETVRLVSCLIAAAFVVMASVMWSAR